DFDLTWKGESGRAPWRRRAEKIVSHIIDSRAIGDYCTCPEPIAPCADDIQGILTGRWVRHFKELPGQRTRMLEDAVLCLRDVVERRIADRVEACPTALGIRQDEFHWAHAVDPQRFGHGVVLKRRVPRAAVTKGHAAAGDDHSDCR